MRRSLWITFVVVLLSAGACRVLVPERFRVNVPVWSLLTGGTATPSQAVVEDRLRVAYGYGIAAYAEEVPNARFMRFSEAGDLLVTTPRTGEVRLLERDADGDGRSDGQRILLAGLNRPHGIDLWQGWLYVGEGDAVARIRFDADSRSVHGQLERIATGLPEGGNHWTRTVRIGPDERMYVSVGSTCNVCIEDHPERATLLRFAPDGSERRIHATGLRNSVGFDWRPGTDELYATDNGRDLLGDDFPPCELNRIVEGGFYGWPFANGDRIPDPDLGAGRDSEIRASLPPVHGFRAHNAPLGITFVRHPGAPDGLQGAALVALHGSWNRSEKDGYAVVSLHWQPDGSIEERPFVTGFLKDGDVIGRPVDVVEGPDGAFYVSDDFANTVWRVARDAGSARRSAVAESPRREAARLALDPAQRERGAVLYAEHDCASCHEVESAAEGVVPVALLELSERYDVESLARFFRAPTPPMPAVSLGDAERHDLAAYVLSRFR